MWAVSAILGAIAIVLCYQGMINLDVGLLGASMVLALIALFALVLTGGKDDTD